MCRLIWPAGHFAEVHRQAARRNHARHFRGRVRRRDPFGGAIAEREHHAERNGFAVQHIGPVLVGRLDSMAERMTQVQQRTHAAFRLVLGDNRRLGPARGCHRMLDRIRRQRQHIGAVRLQPVKKDRIIDQAVFQHFGITGSQVARWKRCQKARIGNHEAWLVEGADHVLAARRVHRRLAANRTVDL